MLSTDSMTRDKPTLCQRCRAALPGGWDSPACPRCLVYFSVEATDPARVFPAGSGRPELGDYELLDEVARGGMGVVYRARQTRLGRTVAVKVLAAGEFASDEARHRFRSEAETVARLQHPGIVAIHDVGETDGLPWFSMDYVAGENLAALVREQPLPAREAAGYARAIAEAVQHAHDHGVLHRDLKPSNVLLDPDTGPRVTDFGIARCADAGKFTRTGEVLGSPGYAAPEQALGGTADARTDVYGLGALLYHLLTARPPFQGPTTDAILLQLREAEPLAPRRLNPAVPRDLETICLRCLRKEPAQRYATAREVAEDLGRFLRGDAIHAKPVSVFGRTWRWCRRRPAVAGLLVALLAVAAFAFWHVESARRAESEAKLRAEGVAVDLREANAQLGESLDRIELDRAENLFREGESADALSLLTRIVRRNPEHRIAGPRLASALWHGDFAMLALPPFRAGGYVLHMEFLRDGRTLLIVRKNGVATWDAPAGRRLLEFQHDGGELSHAVLSPDEATLIAWHDRPGGRMRIFDAKTGSLRAEAAPHEGWLHSVRFAPDGASFITAGSDPVARVFESATGARVGETLAHPAGLWRAVFDARGENIATCAGKIVRVWDAHTLELQRELPALEAEVHLLEFSPDGRWLFAGCMDGAMRFFSAESGLPAGLAMRHSGRVRLAAFSADGTRLVTASSDHTARVWAVPGGEPLTPPLRHRDAVNFAAFSANHARVVTCATDHAARVWDAATGRPHSQPLHHVEQPLAAAFTPDGSTLYTSGADSIVRRWELRGSPALRLDGPPPPAPAAVRVSADGLLTLTLDATKPFAVLSRAASSMQLGGLATESDRVTDAEFSADSALLVTASTDKFARVWDARTASLVTSMRHTRTVAAAAFSPDGGQLATGSWDRTARVWDTRTGAPLSRPLTHDGHVLDVCFSPDGRRIATASRDGTARVWDGATGQPLTGPLRHDGAVTGVRFEPDGQRIVTTSGGGAWEWGVPDFPAPPPGWLSQIAEIVALVDIPPEPVAALALLARYEKARADALANPGDDAYAQLARRLFQKKGSP
jgi:eukaryotic-like serine/threonine-protein kinase